MVAYTGIKIKNIKKNINKEHINIFVNESLCPYYRGNIWNKYKKLGGKHLIYQYYTIIGTVCVKVEENGSPSLLHIWLV